MKSICSLMPYGPLVAFLLLATDCGPCGELPDLSDSCQYGQDGVCDEPVNCPYGTDTTDCERACANEQDPHLLAGACAFLDPPKTVSRSGAVGSGGTNRTTGHIDKTIWCPLAVMPTKTLPAITGSLFPPASIRTHQPLWW